MLRLTSVFSCRLLDKQPVTCPHSDSCSEVLQRGNLDDHLRYHCSGTLVACQFAGAGCEYRGPSKSMNKHQNECKFRKEGKTMRQKIVLFVFRPRRQGAETGRYCSQTKEQASSSLSACIMQRKLQ